MYLISFGVIEVYAMLTKWIPWFIHRYVPSSVNGYLMETVKCTISRISSLESQI